MLPGKSFYTSKEVKRDAFGKNEHEVNYRSILARRETGKGHTALSKFSGLINLPAPMMQIKSFNEIQGNFSEVWKQKVRISMKNNAVNEFSVSEAEGEKDKSINTTMIKYLIKLYLGIVAKKGSFHSHWCCENFCKH